MIKKCKICEVDFNGKSRSKYCSQKCTGYSKQKKITGYKKCLICNKEFPYRDTLKVRSFNGIASIKSKFCSRECSDKYTIIRNKEKIWTNEERNKMGILASNLHKGKPKTEEHRQKMRETNLGDKSHFWKGGISPKNQSERSCIELKEWRREVFIRDNFTCQECKIKGGKLEAHHIKSWAKYKELRFDINNGLTLCKECHKLTDNYKNK